MIDFRYHLVSLVAVFIALAVGIVLGAGPLREGLSSTLEGEVSQLREERVALRQDVDDARRLAEAREQGLHRTGGRAIVGTLTGSRVGLVMLPGSDPGPLDDLTERLEDAGAQVTLMVDVDARWDAFPVPDERAELLRRLGEGLEEPQVEEAGGATVPAVLAAAMVGADEVGQPGAWLGALDDLTEADLIDVTWADGDDDGVLDRRPPDALILFGGGLSLAEAEGTAGSEGAQALAHQVSLAAALAALDVPTVLTGTGTESRPATGSDAATNSDGLDPLLEGVSGRLAAVLALAWETRDRSGHYGLGRLAQAPMPVVPPVRPDPVVDPTGGTGDQDDAGVQDDAGAQETGAP